MLRVAALNKVQDANGNALKFDSIGTAVTKYKYVDSAYLSGVSGAGTVSFYAMLSGIAVSLGISLILYIFYLHLR